MTLPLQLNLHVGMRWGAGYRCCLELDRLLEVKTRRVGEQVNLVVDINMDCGVLVDCLQVRRAIETTDVGACKSQIVESQNII